MTTDEITRLMEAAGLTAKGLSILVGVHETTVKRWRSGARHMPLYAWENCLIKAVFLGNTPRLHIAIRRLAEERGLSCVMGVLNRLYATRRYPEMVAMDD